MSDDLDHLRRDVLAWSDKVRELRDAYHRAADRRAEAMHHAVAAGIPWVTVAADAGIKAPTAIRNVHRWNAKHDIPFPGAANPHTDRARKKRTANKENAAT